MSWLNAVKGAIFEEDPNAAKPAAATPGVTITSANIAPGMAVSMSAPVDAAFVAAIRKAVFGRNTALTQLMATADKMASIIPDPGQRLKAAYAASADGRTVKQIVEAVDVHLSDVDGEELKFKQALDSKAQSEVGPLEHQAQIATSQIEASQREIAAAQARIQTLTADIGTLSTTAAQATQAAQAKKQELDLMTSNFKLAANAVRAELQQNKAAITTALG